MLSVNFTPFPILYTERLTLRQVTKNDAHELFRLRSDKTVMQFIERPMATSVSEAMQLIEKINEDLLNNNGITWAITLKNYAALVGTIGFWRIMKEHYRAEIGYALQPGMHGKGIMQEAMTAVLDYGFRIMKLHSVEANVNPANEASMKLLDRNNFIKEGHFKESYFFNGKFFDSVIYSLLVTKETN
jgi:[ribosomal protein S5]-alanine N-acetyltransferase